MRARWLVLAALLLALDVYLLAYRWADVAGNIEAQFIISTYENRYIFNNFRRDRTTFDTDAVVSRTESRYFDKLTTATKALGLYSQELGAADTATFENPGTGSGLLFPHVLASNLSLNEFLTVLTRPEPGTYYDPGDGSPLVTTAPSQSSDAVLQIAVGSG